LKDTSTVLPIVFGILTSLCFALASLLAQRGYHLAAAPWGAWITLVGNSLFLLSFHFLLHADTRLFVADNLIFVAVGLFVPGVTRVLSFHGIRTMGSGITSTIINTTPMFSTLLAMMLLGERPGPLVLAGVMMTVGGLVTVSWTGERVLWRRTELIYPFLCPLIFAMKDVTVRWGLGGGEAQPTLAAAIAALTSTAEIFAITRFIQRRKFSLPPLNVVRWFFWSGICTGASFLFMYLAFSMERVSIVSPLINSYSVLVLILTPWMARRIESLTARKILGATMVVAGIFLISLGKD
jgi:drug/metabolite transporter (DMT)-like permease